MTEKIKDSTKISMLRYFLALFRYIVGTVSIACGWLNFELNTGCELSKRMSHNLIECTLYCISTTRFSNCSIIFIYTLIITLTHPHFCLPDLYYHSAMAEKIKDSTKISMLRYFLALFRYIVGTVSIACGWFKFERNTDCELSKRMGQNFIECTLYCISTTWFSNGSIIFHLYLDHNSNPCTLLRSRTFTIIRQWQRGSRTEQR